MPHHKRKRPKHQRAGCLLCKPHKDERVSKLRRLPPGQRRKVQREEGLSPLERPANGVARLAYRTADLIERR
jgi:ribosomal protein L44E